MLKYKDLSKYLGRMWTNMLGPQAVLFGFSEAENERVLAERQNGTPLPQTTTVLTFRIDNYDTWRAQRYGSATISYNQYGEEVISELRTFKCIVTIMSKELGMAFDAARFIIANLQNNRYNDFVKDTGRILGIEQISKLKNLSDLENGTWTERVSFEVQMNFIDSFLVDNQTLFVRKPESPSDVVNSVEIQSELIQ